MQAGVPTELHVVPGAVHAFDGFALDIALSQRVRASRYIAINTVAGQSPKERAVTPGELWLDPEVASVLPFLPERPAGASIEEARKELDAMLGVGAPAPGEELLDDHAPDDPGAGRCSGRAGHHLPAARRRRGCCRASWTSTAARSSWAAPRWTTWPTCA